MNLSMSYCSIHQSMDYCNSEFREQQRQASEDALARLREKLTGGYAEGEGDVTFHLSDGSTHFIAKVRVDSVGPGAEKAGVIDVEFYGSDRVVHVPFVRTWEFSYPM